MPTEDRQALEGILVADFSRVLAGPLATMMLGDLGADVIKVESPRGDDTRSWGPPFRGVDSTYFLAVNRNKRGVVLDLATADGHEAGRRLATRADVIVENLRPGTMDRFGLGYESVREANPGIVYCSITGFGRGAGARMPGYDFLAQAVGGLMSVTGHPDGPQTKVGVAVVDVITGLHAALGILAALRLRERTGVGQRIDVNLLSSTLSALVNQSSGYVAAGAVPGRMGNAHPSIAPYETFDAADEPIAIAVGNDAQFAALCEALGVAELAEDERFRRNEDRVRHRRELVAALGLPLAALAADEAIARIRGAGVPCGPVNDLAAAVDLASELGLEPVVEIATDGDGAVEQVASPLTLSATPVTYRRPPPRLGQHTDEVLAWLDDATPATPQASQSPTFEGGSP
jgi:crotonobetainyl-CoA:carnitine CoA-transferase CaiB-like acyl-CoA transferase